MRNLALLLALMCSACFRQVVQTESPHRYLAQRKTIPARRAVQLASVDLKRPVAQLIKGSAYQISGNNVRFGPPYLSALHYFTRLNKLNLIGANLGAKFSMKPAKSVVNGNLVILKLSRLFRSKIVLPCGHASGKCRIVKRANSYLACRIEHVQPESHCVAMASKSSKGDWVISGLDHMDIPNKRKGCDYDLLHERVKVCGPVNVTKLLSLFDYRFRRLPFWFTVRRIGDGKSGLALLFTVHRMKSGFINKRFVSAYLYLHLYHANCYLNGRPVKGIKISMVHTFLESRRASSSSSKWTEPSTGHKKKFWKRIISAIEQSIHRYCVTQKGRYSHPKEKEYWCR